MTRVKVCGITNLEDALSAVEAGADALGFIFYPKSSRFVEPDVAGEITRALPPFLTTVGVFVDASFEEISGIRNRCRLSAIQLHGRETPDFCARFPASVIKAFRVKGQELPEGIAGYTVDAILLDTYQKGLPGGTGKPFSWEVALEAKRFGRVILAGGLNIENIEDALSLVRPYAVDVASGVEKSPGIKNHKLMEQFIRKVKSFS